MNEPTSKPSTESPDFSKLFAEESAVVLLRGKNSFGDTIYSYVKVTFKNVERMQDSIRNRKPFTPSDFGEVVAAGKGEPTDEVKDEIKRMYSIIEQKSEAPAAPAKPPEKKNWDEY